MYYFDTFENSPLLLYNSVFLTTHDLIFRKILTKSLNGENRGHRHGECLIIIECIRDNPGVYDQGNKWRRDIWLVWGVITIGFVVY